MEPQAVRFLNMVEKTETCWLWTGSKSALGYGSATWNGKTASAHRVSYLMHRGAIPKGLELDHLCRNPSCVNPDHLEAVTHGENVRRGWPYREDYHTTHCRHGHEWTPENTYTRPNKKGIAERFCRACNLISHKKDHGTKK